MRDILEALAAGEVTPREAEARLRGYVSGEAGRYDAARPDRRGVPEAVLASGKTPAEAAELAAIALETTEQALVTRADGATREAVLDRVRERGEEVAVREDPRARLVWARTAEPPSVDATVAIVTAGTSDAPPAREAATVVEAMGADVDLLEDVGVAALDRLLDGIDRVRRADAAVVAAGREGSLPTVVAGLVPTPVVALPVGSGYGVGGGGEAALKGALQSCTVLTTVNVDAGFVAGAQAGLIARSIGGARDAEG